MTGRIPRGISGKQGHPNPRQGAYATVAVPLHRELATGTLAGILRRIGMTAEEFTELLR